LKYYYYDFDQATFHSPLDDKYKILNQHSKNDLLKVKESLKEKLLILKERLNDDDFIQSIIELLPEEKKEKVEDNWKE
jgi:hypothetical protein